MHTRPPPSADDDGIFTSMASPPTRHNPPSTGTTTAWADADDADTTLDDVWAAADDDPPPPSDIPRLRQEHATAGYRDGLAAAKAGSVQAGFDEGFGLGATLGLRAGRLLGLLEGLASAPAASSTVGREPGGAGDTDEGRGLQALLPEARRELGARGMFAPAYFAPDGTCLFALVAGGGGRKERRSDGAGGGRVGLVGLGERAEAEGGRKEGAEEVRFADVAASHPLIQKWEGILRSEMERWGLHDAILGGEQWERVDAEGAESKQAEAKVVSKERDGLAW
ncbi:hypothetical protein P8C59_008286 [Phyllachora maydis]|uniref:Protein YAE1 n=1 Tax=Phyllachora maydis TaxID=1825666 RepID=A0AAD9IB53_9PEZI|nr:hypothetical protein P8C59_008286 [Phyllachora maydis]